MPDHRTGDADRSYFKRPWGQPRGGGDKVPERARPLPSGHMTEGEGSFSTHSLRNSRHGDGKNSAEKAGPLSSSYTGSYDMPERVSLNGPISMPSEYGISYEMPQLALIQSNSPRVDPEIDVSAVDDMGQSVDYIKSMGLVDPAYWIHYESHDQYADKVVFVIMPLYHDAPFAGIKQVFVPKSDMNIITPFGVPFWGGNKTSGPWILIVVNSRGNVAAAPLIIE